MDKRITGHLTEKNNMFYIVLNLPSANGKRNRKWISTGYPVKGNKTKATALLKETVCKANTGEDVFGRTGSQKNSMSSGEIRRPSPEMLFSDYMQFWLEWKRPTWEAVTYQGYSRVVKNRIVPYFADQNIRLNELTTLDIQLFYNYLMSEQGNKGNTVLHYHANIRKALADAMKIKLITANPAADVDRPKIDNFTSNYYDADELMGLLEVFKGTRMELPVTLAAYYGLRRSVVVGLMWSAIDYKKQLITISHTVEVLADGGKGKVVAKDRTKNKASFRCLPLIPCVEELLKQTEEQQRKNRKLCGRSYNTKYLDYICVNEQGDLIKPEYVTRTFHSVLEARGMKMIRFHDLRHSCASLLLANGVSIKEIQIWLGHSNYSTTANIYAHLDVAAKQNAAESIANSLSAREVSKPEKKKSVGRRSA